MINICITAKPLERVICVYQQTRTASAGDTTGEAYTRENNKLKARLHRAILSRDKSCDRSCCRPKNFENIHACSQIRNFSKVSGFSGFNLVSITSLSTILQINLLRFLATHDGMQIPTVKQTSSVMRKKTLNSF